jgi:hypothetical protein
MKKTILSLLGVAILVTSANAQIAIAPELGLNMANLTGKSGGASMSTSMKAGLRVGAVADFGLSDNLFLQPGLFYLMNGANFSGGSINVGTLEVPVNVEYKLGEPGANRFFFGAGPFFGFNVGGTLKGGGSSTSLKIGSTKPDMANGVAGDDIKAMDFGLGLNVGYLLANGLFFRAQYQFGLANLDPISDADNTMKSSAIGITVGYYFGAKKHGAPGGHKK